MEASVNRFMAGEVSEVRIDITKQTPEEPAIADRQAQLLFSKNIKITGLVSRDTFCKLHFLSFINLVFLLGKEDVAIDKYRYYQYPSKLHLLLIIPCV